MCGCHTIGTYRKVAHVQVHVGLLRQLVLREGDGEPGRVATRSACVNTRQTGQREREIQERM